MDLIDVFNLICSSHPHDRLKGARNLVKYARAKDVPRIQKAIKEETIPWVRNALQDALFQLIPMPTSLDEKGLETEKISEVAKRDISLRNGDEIISTVLHEILPKLGFIRNAAAKEITNFDTSETKIKIDFLEKLLDLLAEFRKISKTPKIVEFDLAELIDEIIAEHADQLIHKVGPKPMLVSGEPTRIYLAISNGLRNAIDATRPLSLEGARPIAISWGKTDCEYWIFIVDNGIGLVGNIAGMFAIGRTSKSSHYGMGLPLAKQALFSLGGNVQLSPAANGGARFEVKWERINITSKEEECKF